jgi:hypothetical protein
VLTFFFKQRLKGQYIPGKLKEAFSMKDIMTALLATLFVVVTLVSLISADPIPGDANWLSPNRSGDISELEIRYALHK